MTLVAPALPEPVIVLSPAPWAGDEMLVRVLHVLNDGAAPGHPYALLVGGCVRNAVREIPVSDYDLATILPLEDVRARALGAGFRVVDTGVDHGTVMIVAGGRGFEVTRLRRDIQTDGRHAVIVPTDDWALDAARRDFTMNTLYADGAGAVYEFIPSAVQDARAGRVRFVGDPGERVAEDYLRILRFFRFHAFYGAGGMDSPGLAACAAAADKIGTLSRERVTTEFCRWLSADDPVQAIEISFKNNVLNHIIDANINLDGVARLVPVQRAVSWPDMLSRLYVLASGDVDSITRNLRLSNNQINYLEDMSNVKIEDIASLSALKRAVVRYRHMPVLARWLIDVAASGREPPKDFATLRDWTPPICPVSGADLIAQGMPLGPNLGARLRELTEKWISSDFRLSRAELLARDGNL